MPVELVARNAVIVANQFNPSVYSQLWLARQQIVPEADFLAGGVYTEVVSNTSSREFGLLVVPNQLQFTPNLQLVPERENELVMSKVSRLVELLPHVPYQAIGLNFKWHVSADDGDTVALSRRMCFAPTPVHRLFDAPGSRFGAYASQEFQGMRLKLNVLPIMIGTVDSIQIAFNFHRDVVNGEDAVAMIRQVLAQWEAASNEAERLIAQIVEDSNAH